MSIKMSKLAKPLASKLNAAKVATVKQTKLKMPKVLASKPIKSVAIKYPTLAKMPKLTAKKASTKKTKQVLSMKDAIAKFNTDPKFKYS